MENFGFFDQKRFLSFKKLEEKSSFQMLDFQRIQSNHNDAAILRILYSISTKNVVRK